MSNIIKFEQQQQELDYYRSLAVIANKGGTHNMTPEVLMNIMLTAKDLGISPMKAINGGFYVVKGKISMSTALMADRIRKEGHSIRIPEWTSKKCVIIGVRRDNSDSVKFEFTWEDAQAAGLTASDTWKKFPKQMLYNRAMSTLARVLFPDVVGNAYSEDERHDIMDVPPESRPSEDPDEIFFAADPEKTIEVSSEPSQPVVAMIGTPLETLKEYIEADGMSASQLDDYLKILADKGGNTKEEIVASALRPQLLSRFKKSYAEHLASCQMLDAKAV